jgi:hypothetical protein
MDKYEIERQQLIGQVLQGAGGASSADALGRGMQAWEQLAVHLSALIGEAGFCALYSRALSLAGAPSSLREASVSLRATAVLVQQLRDGLLALEPSEACVLNAALLDTFTKLLAGLIGPALTTRLLNSAWADRPEENRNES